MFSFLSKTELVSHPAVPKKLPAVWLFGLQWRSLLAN
jgi:hypothetical protein